MGRPRAAIVGAGLMGGWHARYAARAGVEIAAIVDTRQDAAAALGRRFPDARLFRELPDCLGSCPLDVVHVCTAWDSHAALTEAALQAGKHVLVEKPAAVALAEAQRLADLARSRKLTLCPVHQLPFQRGFERLVKALNRLGAIVRVDYAVSSAGGAGRADRERHSLLLEILPHPLSLLRVLPGAAVDPAAWRVLTFTSDELELAARCGETQIGIRMSLRARPTCHELIVTGTQATARVDLFHGYALLEANAGSRTGKTLAPFLRGSRLLAAATSNLARRAALWEPAYPGLRELIRRFYRAAGAQSAPPVELDEMLETVAVIERVRASPDNGRR